MKNEKNFSQFEESFDTLKNQFELEAYESPTENLFNFVIYAGEHSSKPDIIYFCSMLLATSLNYFKDAYKHSYNLAKKLVKSEPQDLENWEWLLFFADIPDMVMSMQDLEYSIINILKMDNQNRKALDIIHVLSRYLSSDIDNTELENWANSIEDREDIGYKYEELENVIFELSNPILYGDISFKQVNSILSKLNEE